MFLCSSLKRLNVWFSIESKRAGKSRSGDKGEYQQPVPLVWSPMIVFHYHRKDDETANRLSEPHFCTFIHHEKKRKWIF